MPNQSEIDRNALIFDWNRAGESFAPGRRVHWILPAAKQSNRLLEDQDIAALARGDDNP